jgi:hypothetical protein
VGALIPLLLAFEAGYRGRPAGHVLLDVTGFANRYSHLATPELDGSLAWVDELPAQGVPAYVRLDLHLGWTPLPGLTLSLTGRNLLDPSHPKFGQTEADPAATEVPRLILARATWSPA